MAAADLVPSNGSCVVGTLALDFASFEVEGEQSVEDATPYGANVMAKNVGAGTASLRIRVGAFGKAHIAASAPGFNGSAGTWAAAGVSTTLGFDTGCTESGLGVIRSLRAQHARMRAVVPYTFEMLNGNDWTETWAIS